MYLQFCNKWLINFSLISTFRLTNFIYIQYSNHQKSKCIKLKEADRRKTKSFQTNCIRTRPDPDYFLNLEYGRIWFRILDPVDHYSLVLVWSFIPVVEERKACVKSIEKKISNRVGASMQPFLPHFWFQMDQKHYHHIGWI